MNIEKIEVGICADQNISYHFADVGKTINMPKGATKQIDDIVALSPGTITDCECCREDDFVDLEEQGFIIEGEIGADLAHQCPLWELLELKPLLEGE